MFSKGCLPVINRPTRVTKNTSSCIEHIYITSYFTENISIGIIKNDISDHFPIYIVDNNSSTTRFPNKIVKYIRKINNN